MAKQCVVYDGVLFGRQLENLYSPCNTKTQFCCFLYVFGLYTFMSLTGNIISFNERNVVIKEIFRGNSEIFLSGHIIKQHVL